MVLSGGGSVERARLHGMANAIAHRGPDGEGLRVDGSVGLAHRRLAIIDLDSGDQPMENEDGQVVTVFNGEIYNFMDVRRDLEAAGHVFRTSSDTEVLVHGWEEWGEDVVTHLNGMFAFAIHDRRRQKVFLAVDRLGVKPLYWFRGSGCLVFASELGSLIASGLVPREIDPESLELYLHYQYVPAPLTIYKGVRKLAPAERLVYDVGSGELRSSEYWALPVDRPVERGVRIEEWTERLSVLLDDAVRIRLISDVPFGAFLSGGTDSGLVVALMAGRMGKPVKTFSIGLDGVEADELPRARMIADRFRTDHHEFRVQPEGLTIIPALASHFGEPFADSSAVPTWYVSRMAKTHVKMVLSGDGGDEMFAGYRRYPQLAGTRPVGLPNARRMPAPGLPLRDIARAVARDVRRTAVAMKRRMLGRPLPAPSPSRRPWNEVYDVAMSHFSADERRALLGSTATLSGPDYFTSRHALRGADTTIAAAQYCDLKSYLPGDILAKVDRMSMANSLEVRSPLLDYRITELAFRMPTEVKMPEARPDGSTGKFILKELAAGHLGREYVNAPKEGFGIPVNRWLREDRAGYMRDILLGTNSPVFDWLDRGVVRGFAESHLAGRADHAARLWNLLMLDAWFRSVHQRETVAPAGTAASR